MARIVKYIFICLFAVFLMSHNTFAYDLSRDVQLQGQSGFHFNGVYASPSAFSMLDNDKCIRATGTTAITSWGMISNTLSLQAGDFVQIWFSIGINAENNSSDTMIRGLTIQGTSYQTVDVSYESVNPSNGIVRITMRVKDTFTTDTFVVSTSNPFMVLYNNEYVYAGTVTVWRPITNNFNSQDIVNAINSQTNYTQALNDIKNKMDEEKNAAEDATEQAETDSETSQSDVNTATTNLIGALGSIGSALTNAPATDCIIDINTRQFSVGRVNLCSNVPQEVLNFTSGLLAIVLTPIVLYYIFHIITYMYNLFQEFQR